jgi:hypothetical protein
VRVISITRCAGEFDHQVLATPVRTAFAKSPSPCSQRRRTTFSKSPSP